MSAAGPNVKDSEVYAIPEYGSHIDAIRQMMLTIEDDAKEYEKVRRYLKGDQRKPHVPSTARIEVREIAGRSTMNLMPLLVGVPSQMCFIEGYQDGKNLDPPEWEVFKRSKMESKQTVAFRAALTYGNSFLALEPGEHVRDYPAWLQHEPDGGGQDELEMKLLQTANTVAYYSDPVNDSFPAFAMTLRSRPMLDKPGLIVMYDSEAVTYYDWHETGSGKEDLKVNFRWEHKMGYTPVRRLLVQMDDEGAVSGVVGQMIPMQDRVNQTSFDLLVTQTFSSFKVRWASGMLGNPVYDEDPNTGEMEPRVDEHGNQVYEPIPIDQSTWIMTDDPNARVGTLDETPLEGFLEALDVAIRHFAVVGQLPPHNLLGNLSNVTSETLTAAMSQTVRFTHVLKMSWGDAVSDLLGLASIQMGHRDSLEGYEGEVRWRDMSDNTLAAVVDALGKGVQMLGIPQRSMWRHWPGISHAELLEWDEAKASELSEQVMTDGDTPGAGLSRESAAPHASQLPTEPLEPYRGEGLASEV